MRLHLIIIIIIIIMSARVCVVDFSKRIHTAHKAHKAHKSHTSARVCSGFVKEGSCGRKVGGVVLVAFVWEG